MITGDRRAFDTYLTRCLALVESLRYLQIVTLSLHGQRLFEKAQTIRHGCERVNVGASLFLAAKPETTMRALWLMPMHPELRVTNTACMRCRECANVQQ